MRGKPLGPSLKDTSAFYFQSFEDETEAFETGDYTYSRLAHPLVTEAETVMATVEKAPACVAFASGMAAISATLIALASGKTILAQQDAYGGTRRLLSMLAEKGVLELHIWRDLDPPDSTRVRFDLALLEIPTNPLLRVPDLGKWGTISARSGAILVVDSTMATPESVRPLEHGATLVIHSATKYLSGNDATSGGFVCGSSDILATIREWRSYLGTIMTPRQADIVLSGLKTLRNRVRKASQTASWLAQALSDHPKVARLFYPLDPSHPDYESAKRMLKLGGGVLAFELVGGTPCVRRFVNALKDIRIAATFGGRQPVITHPYTTSHRWIPEAERASMDISEGLLRISVGTAPLEILRHDIFSALSIA